MIVDVAKFAQGEEKHWRRLEEILDRRQKDPWTPLTLAEARELDGLYRRTAADLASVTTFSAEVALRRRLEHLVARGHAEIHGARSAGTVRLRPWHWLAVTLPRTFRRQAGAMGLAVAVTVAGMIFGGVAIAVDPGAKQVIMPFSHLLGDPRERVAQEEMTTEDPMAQAKAGFAGMLMKHNTEVTLLVLALGMTWGVGTILLLFSNGVMLGAVIVDYVQAGETTFLSGWLLPHGVVEIPAMLVGAQAGLVLARALVGRDDGRPIGARFRAATPDVATLGGGAALMLVWAGVVESYLSQYHEPVIPYAVKIVFGLVEAALLALYFGYAGRAPDRKEAARG